MHSHLGYIRRLTGSQKALSARTQTTASATTMKLFNIFSGERKKRLTESKWIRQLCNLALELRVDIPSTIFRKQVSNGEFGGAVPGFCWIGEGNSSIDFINLFVWNVEVYSAGFTALADCFNFTLRARYPTFVNRELAVLKTLCLNEFEWMDGWMDKQTKLFHTVFIDFTHIPIIHIPNVRLFRHLSIKEEVWCT